MPLKNGVQVVQEIKTFYKQIQMEIGSINLREPLFVMLTAYKTLHFEKHVKEQGISQCFEKPIDPEQLIEILQQSSE
jgi:CheY-like chemotaxis protein